MNSVYIDSAVAASPIYLGPTNANAVNIGNANCSTNVNGPTYLARNTTGANPTYFEMVSGTGGIYMDFHSNSTYSTDFDARISCNGGTSTYGQGGLELNANTIALIGTTTANGTLVANTIRSSAAATDLNINSAGTSRTKIGGNVPTNTTCMLTVLPTSSYQDAIACGAYIDGNYIISFYNNAGALRGTIGGNGASNVAYATSSDKRLKTNIQSMEPMINKIMSLKPCKYNWKIDNADGYGFIAQEVYSIFPELRFLQSCSNDNYDEPVNIETNEPIYYSLDYGKFTPYLTKALQETIEIIEKQKKEIDEIKMQNNILQSQLSSVLQRLDAGGL